MGGGAIGEARVVLDFLSTSESVLLASEALRLLGVISEFARALAVLPPLDPSGFFCVGCGTGVVACGLACSFTFFSRPRGVRNVAAVAWMGVGRLAWGFSACEGRLPLGGNSSGSALGAPCFVRSSRPIVGGKGLKTCCCLLKLAF